jgi:hypothetical protein
MYYMLLEELRKKCGILTTIRVLNAVHPDVLSIPAYMVGYEPLDFAKLKCRYIRNMNFYRCFKTS